MEIDIGASVPRDARTPPRYAYRLSPQRKITVPVTLKEYEELLAANGFVRIHRSHMINIDFLDKYYKGDGGYVKMKDGSTADVSRQRKDEFMKAIGKLS